PPQRPQPHNLNHQPQAERATTTTQSTTTHRTATTIGAQHAPMAAGVNLHRPSHLAPAIPLPLICPEPAAGVKTGPLRASAHAGVRSVGMFADHSDVYLTAQPNPTLDKQHRSVETTVTQQVSCDRSSHAVIVVIISSQAPNRCIRRLR
ncbi:hypothetical protein, partial [Gordonia asplenii]|uniref:hypothetical protein n=1 Tax=Gordonia asplenii TaxID=2725283 RepID=UPI001B7D565D